MKANYCIDDLYSKKNGEIFSMTFLVFLKIKKKSLFFSKIVEWSQNKETNVKEENKSQNKIEITIP